MTLRDLAEREIAKLQAQQSNCWENYLDKQKVEDRQFLKYDKRVTAAVKQAFSDGLKAYLATQTKVL